MTDTITKDTQASTAAAPSSTTTAPPQTNPKPKNKSKNKSKPRRTRQRRRAAGDSSGDDAEAGSDSSLSSRSDAEASESEGESETKPLAPTKGKPKSTKAQPVFADVSSITPAGWADDTGADVAPISFEDFNSGKQPAKGTGLSIRGRGGKAKVEAGPATKREYTPEETAKYEAQKAKRKEKVKAKKAALKEEKLKGKETVNGGDPAGTDSKPVVSAPTTSGNAAAPKPAKAKGKKRTESTAAQNTPAADQLAASTSAVTLDDASEAKPTEEKVDAAEPSKSTATDNKTGPTATPGTQARPPRQPRVAGRGFEDPKSTPRTGQFWTHDQRLNADGQAPDGARPVNPFFRGRAVPRGTIRGGLRGRGRGGFFPNARGGFVNGGPSRAVELSQEAEGSSKLAMDREYELAEAREQARAGQPVEAVDNVVVAEPAAVTQSPPVPPTQPAADRKWGHEGFEAMSAAQQFRGGFRGRVRGARGRGGFFSRGGHLPFAPQNQPFHPAAVAARAAAAASRSAPSPTVSAASTPAIVNKGKAADDREKMSTQPTADSLLDPADESVKIKFPGSAASVVPASVTSPATSAAQPLSVPATASPAPADAPPSNVTEVESAPIASTSSPAPQSASEPQFPSMQSGSPAPVAAVQAQMYTGGSNNSPFPMGSENGSVGSAQFVQHPGQYYAPGMTPNGEFVPSSMMSRPAFYPQQSHRSYPAQSPQFYPAQSPYSPGPYDQQQRGSFSGVPMASPQGAYFAGTANGRNSPLNPYAGQQSGGGYFAPVRGSSKVAIRAPMQSQSTGDEAGDAGGQANGHVDSASAGGAYYAQHYNPYVQPFVPGQRQETVYYPQANGQQYAWQGYGEQAYYDGNAAYGY